MGGGGDHGPRPPPSQRLIVAEPEEVASICAYMALDAPASMTGAVVDVHGASYAR